MGGGLVFQINRHLDPCVLNSYQSNEFEAIWLEMNHPDVMMATNGPPCKPKFIVAMAHESNDSVQFYTYIKTILNKRKYRRFHMNTLEVTES